MKFLLDDLNLKHNKEKFIDLFDQEVSYTTADVIVMFCSVVGIKDGTLQEVHTVKKYMVMKIKVLYKEQLFRNVCYCSCLCGRKTNR